MSDKEEFSLSIYARTKYAREGFLLNRLLGIPFWVMFTLLPVILYKDLHFSPLEITLIIALKPMSALLAPYWSLSIHQRQDLLVSNLIWANFLRYLPFLFFPWIQSPWLIIFSFVIYMALSRGVIPAWMEVFKQYFKEIEREKVFAYGTVLDYLGSAALPIFLGFMLDNYHETWRYLFFGSALIGLCSTYFLMRIPPLCFKIEKIASSHNLLEFVVKPWKQSYQLLKTNLDFKSFQISFMLGGAGLMIMQPALPMFFVDILNLSYTHMAIAIVACKSIGYAISSPIWVKIFRKANLYYFTALVTLLAAIFPFLLMSAIGSSVFLYIAYITYGIMQGGSELSWHFSGPIFSKEADSTLFSRTNVLTVGLRGCIFPFLGSFLYTITSSSIVLIIGSIFCLIATQQLMLQKRKYVPT